MAAQWYETGMSRIKTGISSRAYKAIQNELGRHPDTETGGLLLGYEVKNKILVVEATDSGFHAIHEEHTFVYDQEYEQHFCETISCLYEPPLKLVGLWHKHNQFGGEWPFSYADEEMHEQLLTLCGSHCLSILFERQDAENYAMRVFSLTHDGEHVEVTNSCELYCGTGMAMQDFSAWFSDKIAE